MAGHSSTSRALCLARASGRQSDADALRSQRRAAAAAILQPIMDTPSQRELLATLSRRGLVSVLGPRRSAKTTVVGRYVTACMLVHDDWVCRIPAQRLAGPSQTWIKRERDGMLALLERHDMAQHARVSHQQSSVVQVVFDWGSALYVHSVATEYAVHEKRGVTADLWWCPEAQHLELLNTVVNELAVPTLADSDATLVADGTPGREVDSSFFAYTRPTTAGWSNVRLNSWDNPHFGPDFATRWRRLVSKILVSARSDYQLSDEDLARFAKLTEQDLADIVAGRADEDTTRWIAGLDPRVQREFLGLWLAGGDDYVTAWHDAPPEKHWARVLRSPLSLPDDVPIVGNDIAHRLEVLTEMLELPRRLRAHHRWSAGMGVDLGWSDSASAWSIPVWSPRKPGHVYILLTDKEHRMTDDAILGRTEMYVDELRAAGAAVVGVRADNNGMRMNSHAAWSTSFFSRFDGRVPLELAAKANKEDQVAAMNSDMMHGQLHLVAGDPLDIECRFLRYRLKKENNPTREIHKHRMVTLPDGTRIQPGDHAYDATRYARPLCPYTTWRPAPKVEPSWFDEQLAQQDEQELR